MRFASRDLRRVALALFAAIAVAIGLLAAPPAADAHELDHPPPNFAPAAPLSSGVNSGAAGEGDNIGWELISTIPTGNPHTDIDFFTHGGETYAAVGTLGAGPNAGGQSIIKLTATDDAGEQTVDPSYVVGHPSAECAFIDPLAALGLQHDVEATPKSGAILNNSSYLPPDLEADAQLLIDATDAEGRCHDQGNFGSPDLGSPKGGLEIVDVTDIESPVEIGLTSHIGEAHTVNIDPKRPHIAYSVTSDAVSVSVDADDIDGDGNTEELIRENEDPADTDRFDLDGFEVVDLSSCMNVNDRATFAADADLEAKREGCRPQVYRYRYPTLDMSLGYAAEQSIEEGEAVTIYGCHELEIYPNDHLTCGSGAALLAFDMAGAFDDMGTPDDFTDDTPRGTPLPCRPRASSTAAPAYDTGATVMDCVEGGTDEAPVDLTVANWLETGAPSLEGVNWLGTVYHQGRGAGDFGSAEDIDFNHEAEYTHTGLHLFATDERGGGVTPPGATCSPGVDNSVGNGGIHAYETDKLLRVRPDSPEVAFEAYAHGTDGEKAIFRAPIRTQAHATVCTAHVFQQIPGQNRIFMGWYSQGTQVLDYVELPDGRLEWIEDQEAQEGGEGQTAQAATSQPGYFIPENANTWVSHIFKVDENEDGTFTYYGATGDFNLGEAGRNAVDVYKVTLPAPADECTLAPVAEEYTDRDEAREVHRSNVDCVLHYAIARGTSDTTYSPGVKVTREQMASFIVNAIEAAGAGEKLPATGGPDAFTDIRNSRHRDNINRLATAGIIKGTGGGKFSTERQITRDQMATFIVAAARFITGEEMTAARTDRFGDVGARNPHRNNINAGFEQELFSGTKAPEEGQPNSGEFSPSVRVQRDQMATFLVRLFQTWTLPHSVETTG